MVAAEVLDRVLPLPIRIVGWRVQDSGATLADALVVAVDVFDTHDHGLLR